MTFLSGAYQRDLDRIIDDVREQSEERQIVKVVGQPHIPYLTLALQFLLLKQLNYSPEQVRLYCVSTTLIQMGLDVHNEVAESAKDDEHKARQLHVLAGDLYSGKFYQILARQGAIRVIHFLSDAICRINQAKTNVYYMLKENQVSVKQYVQEIERMCSSLLQAWLQNEPSSQENDWNSMITNLLTAETLTKHVNHSVSATWPIGMMTQVTHKIQQMIHHSRSLLTEWSCDDTKRELERLIDVYFPDVVGLGKTAEEC